MLAVPIFLAVTTPLSTVATVASSVLHSTSLSVALFGVNVTVNVSVEFNKMLVSVLFNLIEVSSTLEPEFDELELVEAPLSELVVEPLLLFELVGSLGSQAARLVNDSNATNTVLNLILFITKTSFVNSLNNHNQ